MRAGSCHAPLWLLVVHPVSFQETSPAFTPSPTVWCSSPHFPFISNSLHRPRSPPNRQGCCGWHVSSWEQPCRVDGPQHTERTDNPALSVCVCVCVFFPSSFLRCTKSGLLVLWPSDSNYVHVCVCVCVHAVSRTSDSLAVKRGCDHQLFTKCILGRKDWWSINRTKHNSLASSKKQCTSHRPF